MHVVNVANAAPRTVAGAILPGWMPREQAIELLTKECVEPAFDAAQAGEVWEHYHRLVEELPQRDGAAPQRLQLNVAERNEANAFLHRMRQAGAANILDVIKFDPRQCIVWQLQVILERSEAYARNMATAHTKLRHCLGLHAAPAGQVQIMSMPNDVRVQIPHAEFILNFLPP